MSTCLKCSVHCCGGSEVKAPILLPHEIEKFKNFVEECELGFYRLKRDPVTRTCVFWQDGLCTCYVDRPLECRLYPWVLTWDGEINLRLHSDCPKSKLFPRPELPDLSKIPNEWWGNFEKLSI